MKSAKRISRRECLFFCKNRKLRALRLAVACLSVAGTVSEPLAQQLLDAGWDDPFFRPLVEQDAAPGDAALPFTFSLPVLGFRLGVINGPDAALGSLGTELAASVAMWAACADANPTVITVPQTIEQAAGTEPGSWFTSTYDFGCIQIVIEGDRNLPDPEVVGEAEPLPEAARLR